MQAQARILTARWPSICPAPKRIWSHCACGKASSDSSGTQRRRTTRSSCSWSTAAAAFALVRCLSWYHCDWLIDELVLWSILYINMDSYVDHEKNHRSRPAPPWRIRLVANRENGRDATNVMIPNFDDIISAPIEGNWATQSWYSGTLKFWPQR